MHKYKKVYKLENKLSGISKYDHNLIIAQNHKFYTQDCTKTRNQD